MATQITGQGIAPLQTVVRGNTIPAQAFIFTVNGVAANITSATYAIRNARGTANDAYGTVLVPPTACAVAGNMVTRPSIADTETDTWPVGKVAWDIELTLASGEKKTWIRGEFNVLRTEQ